jgi:hypothetical protein
VKPQVSTYLPIGSMSANRLKAANLLRIITLLFIVQLITSYTAEPNGAVAAHIYDQHVFVPPLIAVAFIVGFNSERNMLYCGGLFILYMLFYGGVGRY